MDRGISLGLAATNPKGKYSTVSLICIVYILCDLSNKDPNEKALTWDGTCARASSY